ncbi:MAG TPA: hypothetical protein VEB63_01410 [Chitinophagaceae bacterium]|nr:hypothetical protein [Chitinophagaceae bacterium]
MSEIRHIFILAAALILLGCGGRKQTNSAGGDPTSSVDFIGLFPPGNLPLVFGDTVFLKTPAGKPVTHEVFTRFVPDSVLKKVFGRGKPVIHPLGRVEVRGRETYLFARLTAGEKKSIYVLCFDPEERYVAALPLLWPARNSGNTQTLQMDRKYLITRTVTRRNSDGSSSDGRDVYMLNADARNFMLIMTDALEDRPTELVNPIDTLARKNRLAGDYTAGKMNLVSIRDGSRPDRLRFFIHIDKHNGDCLGELRGEAHIRSANFAEYRQDGDPCIMEFRFSSQSVSLKETGCGTHRSLRCLFDGRFTRKKDARPTGRRR